MDRPVNKIGSTAREYARGDTNSALMRGLAKDDKTSEIIAVMQYGRENLDQVKELAKLTHGVEE